MSMVMYLVTTMYVPCFCSCCIVGDINLNNSCMAQAIGLCQIPLGMKGIKHNTSMVGKSSSKQH